MRIKTMCITLLAIIILLSGCGNKENLMPTASWDPAATPAPTVDPVALTIETFFKDYVDTNQRPIGVMVDNDDDNARPHAGLNEAYLIYEMVVEGGATRFLAFFRDNVEKIGPVRSSRHYFLDYVMENDAIYTHYGWSPQAIKDISAFGIDKINGVLGGDGNAFWREEKYKGDWHSAYTSMQNIKDMATKKGFDTEKINTLVDIIADVVENGLDVVEKYGVDANLKTEMEYLINTLNTLTNNQFNIKFDISIVRGQGYYTGTIYEFYTNGFGGAIGAGGRYDKMIEKITGYAVPAVGASIGFEPVTMLIKERGLTFNAKQNLALIYDKEEDIKTVFDIKQKLMQ